jgi:hypothetical protein
VRIRNGAATAVFCLTAAIAAAAVTDPSVEGLANRGAFGPGVFTDHSNIDVAPALIAGFLFALALIAGLVRRMLCRGVGRAPDWLRTPAIVARTPLVRLVPGIFALQLLVLWSMETLEQIAVAGHPLAGTIWLGGPVLISLIFHAVGCLAVTWLLARTLRWSAQTIVAVVRFVRRLFYERAPARAARRSRTVEVAAARFFEALLARLNGRAPPYRSA